MVHGAPALRMLHDLSRWQKMKRLRSTALAMRSRSRPRAPAYYYAQAAWSFAHGEAARARNGCKRATDVIFAAKDNGLVRAPSFRFRLAQDRSRRSVDSSNSVPAA